MERKGCALSELVSNVEIYLQLVQSKDLNKKVKRHDLKHIAFWHGYYASVVSAISENKKPVIVKGTYIQINANVQKDFASFSNLELIAMIKKSQKQLLQALEKITEKQTIPYKTKARLYSKEEYIDTVVSHFVMHIEYLKKVIGGLPKTEYVFHDL